MTNPGIMWVTYGAGNFVGSGNNGVWKSTNGTTWTKVSSTFVGAIKFSPTLGLFFSDDGGTSKDAVSWQLFGLGFYNQGLWVDSGSGVIFNGYNQLSRTFVPNFYDGTVSTGAVNAPMSFTVSVSP